MSEMIERVARAMWDRAHAQIPQTFSSTIMVEEMWRDARYSYMDVARVAIAAMRDPTEAMIERGREQTAGDWTDDGRSSARGCWEVMIDAALSESS